MTIHTKTLSNGFRIIYETPHSKTPFTSFQVFCDVGSIHEPEHLRGVSHFIEHMCFKGTRSVPKSKDIFYVYDNVGAYFNASTTKRFTNYMVKCQDIYVNNCLDILSDMMLNSTFRSGEFEKEEDVVIEENIKNDDDPEDQLSEFSDTIVYANTPFQYPVDTLGYHISLDEKKRKKRFDRKSVLQFYKNNYHAEKMILSIVSNIPFDKIIKMVQKTDFAKRVSIPILSNTLSLALPTPLTDIQYNIKKMPSLKSTHISISFKTCTQDSKDKYILQFLENVLGGALSSRLFTILREKHGLTYRSNIYTYTCEVMGEFTIYAQLDSNKLLKNGVKGPGVLPLLIEMINHLIHKGITLDEFNMFHNNMRGKMILNQEDLDTQTEYNGTEYLLYNEPEKIIPYSKLYDTVYRNITLEQIHSCIRTYFRKDRTVVCMIGGTVPPLDKIASVCEKMSQ